MLEHRLEMLGSALAHRRGFAPATLRSKSCPMGARSGDVTRETAKMAVKLAALCVAYAVTARIGLKLDAVSGFATLVWAPSGIALALLVVWGQRLWPAVAIAAFYVNWSQGAPAPVAAGIAFGNTLEAVVGVALLRRAALDPALSRVRDAVALVVLAAIASTCVSATLGAGSLWAGKVIPAEDVVSTWKAWWLGDALGNLVVAPFLLAWMAAARQPMPPARWLEAALLSIVTAALSWKVFGDLPFAISHGPLGQAFVLYPALIYASLRYRVRGAVSATLLVSAIAIADTVAGHGPFVRESLASSLLLLQSFMGISAATCLLLAAAMGERDRAILAAQLVADDNARLYDQAQQAIRARDDFLSIASHELKTPITSLELQVASLAQIVPSNERVVGKLGSIKRQADRLRALIERLLDVSRAMAGRLTLEPQETDFRRVIDEVVARSREQLAKASSTPIVEGATSCVGHWDPLRLDQIVTNLLTNAMKYGGGKPILLTLHASNDAKAVLTVTDHGIGIAPEDQSRIFERFERAASARPVGGLGLGLWIVKQLVVAMGGEISVESKSGQGAQFTVRLPLLPQVRKGEEPARLH